LTDLASLGKHFAVTDKRIRFFGCQAEKVGGSWKIAFSEDGIELGIPVKTQPSPSTRILTGIEQLQRKNLEEQIHHIAVNPIQAIILIIEGKLTLQHLRAAEERDTYVVFKGVSFWEKFYDVVVEPAEDSRPPQLIDEYGQPI
jgi:hypothetical protein